MAGIKISAAAKSWGVTRQTIYRRIENGRIHRVSLPDGGSGVDTEEMSQEFGPAGASDGRTGSVKRSAEAEQSPEFWLLRELIQAKNDQIETLKMQLRFEQARNAGRGRRRPPRAS